MQASIQGTPPSVFVPWLMHEASMTDKLAALTGDCEVNLLQQRWLSECWFSRFVHADKPGRVLCREVLITSGDRMCWYARTLIPERTYSLHVGLFDQLMHQSLGRLIFNTSEISRIALNAYAVQAQHHAFHWPQPVWLRDAQTLWLRRSELRVSDSHPFYLYEILLPEFEEVLACI